jgi:phosphoribosylanthranilate isomerase
MTTHVKICGITTADIMHVALDAGADYVGLVFFPKSPRNVGLSDAGALGEMARDRALIVALTVDADDSLLDDSGRKVRPDILQLHGHETPDRCRAIKSRWPAVQIMKAIGVATPQDVALATSYANAADLILFDAKPPKDSLIPGGNGVTFDWSMLDRAPRPFMLSGGLTPDNVAAAVRATGAHAVDVSSGVESAPGVKAANLVRRFIAAAKAPSNQPSDAVERSRVLPDKV